MLIREPTLTNVYHEPGPVTWHCIVSEIMANDGSIWTQSGFIKLSLSRPSSRTIDRKGCINGQVIIIKRVSNKLISMSDRGRRLMEEPAQNCFSQCKDILLII